MASFSLLNISRPPPTCIDKSCKSQIEVPQLAEDGIESLSKPKHSNQYFVDHSAEIDDEFDKRRSDLEDRRNEVASELDIKRQEKRTTTKNNGGNYRRQN